MKRVNAKYWILLTVLAVLLIWTSHSYYAKGTVYSLLAEDPNSLSEYINGFGSVSWLIFTLIVIIEVIVAPIPALTLYIAGGALFGAFLGGLLSLTGNVIGAIIAFYLARTYGREWTKKKISKKSMKKFDNFSDKYGAFAIFFLRINPFTSSDLFSYAAGLTSMKPKSLILGTFFGLAPLIFIQSYLGQDIVANNPLLSLAVIIGTIIYLLIFIIAIIKLNKKN